MTSENASVELWPHIRFSQWLALLLFCGVGLIQLSTIHTTASAGAVMTPDGIEKTTAVKLQELAPAPRISSEEARPYITAESVIVWDRNSQMALFESSPDEGRAPASTTKLVTALVARELYPLDKKITIESEANTQGYVMGLEANEVITVESLLAGLLINSGNDAAFALANAHENGYSGFVEAMNATLSKLPVSEFAYMTNPSGLDVSGHLLTARDLAIIYDQVAQDPVLAEFMQTSNRVISDVDDSITHNLTNTNQLLLTDLPVIGGKTGTTVAAGQVLVTAFEHEGHELVIVVMASQDRYQDTRVLYNWVTEHYFWDPLELENLLDLEHGE